MDIPTFLSGIVPSLIGGITSLVGANKAEKQSARMLGQQQWFADKQATIAYQRQLEMADKMNIYNSPVQQMQRYRQAGLNPYLLYGEGGQSIAAASPSVSQANSPSASYAPNRYDAASMHAQTAFQNFIALRNLENQTDVAKAQANALNAQAGESVAKTAYQKLLIDKDGVIKDMQAVLIQSNIANVDANTCYINAKRMFIKWEQDNIEADIKVKERQARVFEAQAIIQEALAKKADSFAAAQLGKLLSEIALNVANKNKVKLEASVVKFRAFTERMNAEANKKNADTNERNAKTAEGHLKVAQDAQKLAEWLGIKQGNLLAIQAWATERGVDQRDKQLETDKEARTKYTMKDFGNDVMDMFKIVLSAAVGANGIFSNDAGESVAPFLGSSTGEMYLP